MTRSLALALGLSIAVVSPAASEVRVWKSASGKHETRAELLEIKQDCVVLKTEDGVTVEVSLDRLSDADRQFIERSRQPRRPASSRTSDGKKNPAAEQIEQQARQCYTAKIALLLYEVFLADETVTDDAKEAARHKLPFWEDAAEKDLVRLGKKWVTRAEVQKARVDAEALVNEGLELLRLMNNDLAKEKFQKASEADPNSARADYLMGLIYARVGRNFTKAQAHFKECSYREPDNVCALNNLALVEMFLGDHKNALKHFQAAVAISPGIPEIGHNLGRVLDQAGKGKVVIPASIRAGYGDLYGSVLKQQGTPVQRGVQWLYMVPLASAVDKTQEPTDLVITGSGTGFVVHPQFVLTNGDVVGRAKTFLIDDPRNSEETKMPATMVALEERLDLALLRCENLSAPPIVLCTERLMDPMDVLLLSFPEYSILSSNLATLRARLIPYYPWDTAVLHLSDEVGKGGKGGGPVCNNQGEVVALQCAYYDSRGKRARAIPIQYALPFLKGHVENFSSEKSDRDLLDWAQIDAKARKSTVRILRQESKSVKLTMDGRVHTDWVEERMCIACRGSGRRECPNRGCKKGAIKVLVPVYKGNHPTTGKEEYQNTWFPKPCPTCDGKAYVDCPLCNEGVSND